MLNHKGTKMLETDRLMLRPFTKADAYAVFNNYSNDERVTKYLPWNPIKNENEALEKCVEREKKYSNLDYYHWAIVTKGENELIGAIRGIDYNDKKEIIEVGYCIGYKRWGMGYGTEALHEIIRYFLIEVGFYRIEATHQLDNKASGRVMEKCGMKFEGILRGGCLNNKLEHVDCAIYSILKTDII